MNVRWPVVCILDGMGQEPEAQPWVGHFRERGNRYSDSLDECIVPPSSSEKLTSTRGEHIGTHISDNLPQLEVVGLRTTDCHGTDCPDAVPSVHNRRSSYHCRRQRNLHLADAHSAGARCHDCLLRVPEGTRERCVVMSDWDQTRSWLTSAFSTRSSWERGVRRDKDSMGI
jgi:hypothetical protein